MTGNEAIQKIRILLSGEPEVIVAPAAMASATLIDGTAVEVEGEFEVGKPLFVVTAEGNIPAPAGMHQTTDNVVVTVDEAGIITKVEEIASEEALEDEVKTEEVAMEEVAVEETEDAETMVIKIVEAMKPYFEEIKDLKEQVLEMEKKFQKFSKEPAAKPIKKAVEFEANRFSAVERIANLRKSK